jgi:hypothetical protein
MSQGIKHGRSAQQSAKILHGIKHGSSRSAWAAHVEHRRNDVYVPHAMHALSGPPADSGTPTARHCLASTWPPSCQHGRDNPRGTAQVRHLPQGMRHGLCVSPCHNNYTGKTTLGSPELCVLAGVYVLTMHALIYTQSVNTFHMFQVTGPSHYRPQHWQSPHAWAIRLSSWAFR